MRLPRTKAGSGYLDSAGDDWQSLSLLKTPFLEVTPISPLWPDTAIFCTCRVEGALVYRTIDDIFYRKSTGMCSPVMQLNALRYRVVRILSCGRTQNANVIERCHKECARGDEMGNAYGDAANERR